MRTIVRLLVVALAAVAVPGAAALAEDAPAEPVRERLSEPGAVSRWAFVVDPGYARAEPSRRARPVGRLRARTPDGTPELVLLLERTAAPGGEEWVRVRLPILPNNSTGWVPRSALGRFRSVRTWLRVDRGALRATLVRDGRVVFRAPIGIGRSRWPTPAGEFYVRNRLPGGGGAYGPLAFGTSARSPTLTDWPGGGVVGIHGTNQPGLIPGRVSHGCVRLRNRDVLRLGRLMPIGTPITVS
jgi:hypothetical protein